MPVIPGHIMMDTDMSFDSIAKAGSMLGSGGVIVMSESGVWSEACYVCLILLRRVLRSVYAMSGRNWMALENCPVELRRRAGDEEDLDKLLSLAIEFRGKTICALGDAAAMPVRAFVGEF